MLPAPQLVKEIEAEGDEARAFELDARDVVGTMIISPHQPVVWSMMKFLKVSGDGTAQ